MDGRKPPRSLRSRLLTAVLLCWVLPVLCVTLLAGWLIGLGYERSARQELDARAENALEHDLTARRGGRLCLRARREGDRAVLEVEHDGSMSEADRAQIEAMLASTVEDTEISGQVGLRNVRQRLRLLYGERGELSLRQSGPDSILARISFPLA